MRCSMTAIRTTLLVTLLLLGMSRAKAQLIVQDGDFSSWSSFTRVLDDPTAAGTGPGTSTASPMRVATGGNPDAFFQSVHTIVFGDVLYSGGVKQDATYNPQLLGAIHDVSLAADLIHPDVGSTAWQLVIEQTGTLYYSVPLNGFAQGGWRTVALASMTPNDFDTNPLAGSFGVVPDGNRPDFSVNAPLLKFGFAFGNRISGGTAVNTIGLDNFRLTVNPVPEPPGARTLGVGMLGFLLCASAVYGRENRANGRAKMARARVFEIFMLKP